MPEFSRWGLTLCELLCQLLSVAALNPKSTLETLRIWDLTPSAGIHPIVWSSACTELQNGVSYEGYRFESSVEPCE